MSEITDIIRKSNALKYVVFAKDVIYRADTDRFEGMVSAFQDITYSRVSSKQGGSQFQQLTPCHSMQSVHS